MNCEHAWITDCVRLSHKCVKCGMTELEIAKAELADAIYWRDVWKTTCDAHCVVLDDKDREIKELKQLKSAPAVLLLDLERTREHNAYLEKEIKRLKGTQS